MAASTWIGLPLAMEEVMPLERGGLLKVARGGELFKCRHRKAVLSRSAVWFRRPQRAHFNRPAWPERWMT